MLNLLILVRNLKSEKNYRFSNSVLRLIFFLITACEFKNLPKTRKLFCLPLSTLKKSMQKRFSILQIFFSLLLKNTFPCLFVILLILLIKQFLTPKCGTTHKNKISQKKFSCHFLKKSPLITTNQKTPKTGFYRLLSEKPVLTDY